ncbi:MAG TPA: NDP-hexose 4-ketoreductase, partial [Dehalococcoidia bacterium]|nr:NDP-hexose 4-ketoreductase [Dehalococcoidia bacterium]
QYEKMKQKVLDELKRVFKPEFLNRIDSTVVFHALSKEHIRKIVDLQLQEVEKNLLMKGVTLEVTDAARDWLGERGYDQVFGARPLRRVIQNEVEDRLSEALLEGRFQPGDRIQIDVQGDDIVLVNVSEPAAV